MAGFPISILVVGGALLLPLGWAPGVGDGGATSNQWGDAVYMSSCQHTNIYNTFADFYPPILTFTRKKGKTPS